MLLVESGSGWASVVASKVSAGAAAAAKEIGASGFFIFLWGLHTFWMGGIIGVLKMRVLKRVNYLKRF